MDSQYPFFQVNVWSSGFSHGRLWIEISALLTDLAIQLALTLSDVQKIYHIIWLFYLLNHIRENVALIPLL